MLALTFSASDSIFHGEYGGHIGMEQNFPDNALFLADNLEVLRGINTGTVDLIATDPPFNTQRNRSGTAGFYVDNWKWGDTGILPDQWKWNEVHPAWLEQIADAEPSLVKVIEATKSCHDDGIAAYLCFMGVRLLEMKRVLKPTGSIFLHCDHKANGYLRMAMDAIFGHTNFRNEIVWKSSQGAKNNAKRFHREHDTLFYYSLEKSACTWNPIYVPLTEDEMAKQYKYTDNEGRRYGAWDLTVPGGAGYEYEFLGTTRRWRYPLRRMQELMEDGRILHKSITPGCGFKVARFKRYLTDSDGALMGDVWTDIKVLGRGSRERTGSPDQKPLALYERIVEVGSDPGDIVLDPFAGCATTMIAARNLGRRFVGIDRRKDAPLHVINRILGTSYKIEEERNNPHFVGFIHQQFSELGYHYAEQAPVRTDDGSNVPDLPPVYASRPASMRRAEMVRVLADRWGVRCWGCGFEPPRVDYLELDHITPHSGGGSNELDNRALLCGPCNRYKSNALTLVKLRKDNERGNHWYGNPPIDLSIQLRAAANWARDYMAARVVLTCGC